MRLRIISEIIVCKQVEVARPMEKSKKRVREYPENTSSFQDQSKVLKSNIHNSHIARVNTSLFLFERYCFFIPPILRLRLIQF